MQISIVTLFTLTFLLAVVSCLSRSIHDSRSGRLELTIASHSRRARPIGSTQLGHSTHHRRSHRHVARAAGTPVMKKRGRKCKARPTASVAALDYASGSSAFSASTTSTASLGTPSDTTSVATSTVSAAYTPSSSSYVAPTLSSTSSYVPPTKTSTSSYVAPTSSATPTQDTSSSAALAETSSASSGGSSGSSGFSGQATFYAPGMGACGETNSGSDFIVAISHELFDSAPGYNGNPNENPYCNKKINAHLGGNTVSATVTDRCEACVWGDLDFTSTGFLALVEGIVQNAASGLNIGRASDMTWEWA